MQRENVKPDQIIGEHPLRRWQDPALWHVICKRAPVHFAVIHDRLKILKLFCQKNLICYIVKDGTGRNIWRLALLHKARKIMPFLVVKQWSKYISDNVVNKHEMKRQTLSLENGGPYSENSPKLSVMEKKDENDDFADFSSKMSVVTSSSSSSDKTQAQWSIFRKNPEVGFDQNSTIRESIATLLLDIRASEIVQE